MGNGVCREIYYTCLAPPEKWIRRPLTHRALFVFGLSSRPQHLTLPPLLPSLLSYYPDDDTLGPPLILPRRPCEQVDRTAPNHGFTANRVAFNPGDHNFLTTSGPMHLRLWYAASDNILKAYAILPQAREQVMARPPCCHARTTCCFT